MRSTPRILAVIGVVMLIVIGWRVITGGPLGPRSYGFIVVTLAVWIAAAVMARRAPGPTIPPRV